MNSKNTLVKNGCQVTRNKLIKQSQSDTTNMSDWFFLAAKNVSKWIAWYSLETQPNQIKFFLFDAQEPNEYTSEKMGLKNNNSTRQNIKAIFSTKFRMQKQVV